MKDLVKNGRDKPKTTINKKGLEKMLKGKVIEINGKEYELTKEAIKSVSVK